MLSSQTYVQYLEGIVLSLLAERDDDKDIVSVDHTHPSWSPPTTFSVFLVRDQIKQQRKRREEHELS